MSLAGAMGGTRPALPLTAAGLEARAAAELAPEVFAYVAGSASNERTAAANLAAFGRYRIVPRMWRGTLT